MKDTIYAPSTAIGGAIAVIRISGPEAGKTIALLDQDIRKTPRRMRHVLVRDQGEVLDNCMAVYFPEPGTYTGENLVEINCHGGLQTVRRILESLGKLGFRPAEGGEFTRRAFLNGKMDLAEAEAVMDLITADAEQSRKAAVLQLQGSVGRMIREVESIILDALSGIDAAIDYPEEAEAEAYADLPQRIAEAKLRIERLLADGKRGRVLRDGLRVAILGRPNVGKSSLMNALLGMDRAIVTAIPGTTRDILDEKVSFDGVPIRLIDTAGLRDATDEAEQIGVNRARESMTTADVLCIVLDASVPLMDTDRKILLETQGDPRRILLLNKCDLPNRTDVDGLQISAKMGQGLDQLKTRILQMAAPEKGDCTCITNERHLHLLSEALEALRAAEGTEELDCKATDLQNALHSLGQITGTDVDAAVIDRVFSRFCVGK